MQQRIQDFPDGRGRGGGDRQPQRYGKKLLFRMFLFAEIRMKIKDIRSGSVYKEM